MGLARLCTGDTVRIVTITGGAFGNSPTLTTSGTDIDCRIDTLSGSEDRRGGSAESKQSLQAFFRSDIGLAVGKYLKWTATGGVALATNRYLRCTNYYSEGRPGQVPLYWVADLVEETVDDIAGAIS